MSDSVFRVSSTVVLNNQHSAALARNSSTSLANSADIIAEALLRVNVVTTDACGCLSGAHYGSKGFNGHDCQSGVVTNVSSTPCGEPCNSLASDQARDHTGASRAAASQSLEYLLEAVPETVPWAFLYGHDTSTSRV